MKEWKAKNERFRIFLKVRTYIIIMCSGASGGLTWGSHVLYTSTCVYVHVWVLVWSFVLYVRPPLGLTWGSCVCGYWVELCSLCQTSSGSDMGISHPIALGWSLVVWDAIKTCWDIFCVSLIEFLKVVKKNSGGLCEISIISLTRSILTKCHNFGLA